MACYYAESQLISVSEKGNAEERNRRIEQSREEEIHKASKKWETGNVDSISKHSLPT